MKFAVLLIVGLSACAHAPATTSSRLARPDDPIFGVDKVKHFFIAGFVETMAFSGTLAAGANHPTARAVGIGATAAASLGREIHDGQTKGHFSVRDLVWDALGASAALLIVNKTQR